MGAAPINPSGMSLLLGFGSPESARREQRGDHIATVLDIAEPMVEFQASRFEQPLIPGFEGTGRVIATEKPIEIEKAAVYFASEKPSSPSDNLFALMAA